MVAIPFPITSAPGFRPQESRGRLLNCFAEPMGEGTQDAPPPAKRVRVPGMTTVFTSAQSGFRGMALLAGAKPLYAAFSGQLYKAAAGDAALTLHGALLGSGSVYFARNNNVTPDKVVVTTENGGFAIIDPNTLTPFGSVTPPGFINTMPQPNGVCSIDGYFVFTIGDGRIYASDLNSLNVNQLSLGTADVKPDPPVRPIPYSGRLLIFGQQSLEFWTDVGAVPFPFQRSVTVPTGLIGPDAVAGWEDGWGAGLLWVADDATVRQLDGYTPTKVSTFDVDRALARDPSKSTLMANVHMVDGHPMWSITGQSFTWSYDISTKKWHERASYLDDRWRGKQTVRAFDKWLVGDRGPFTGLDGSGNKTYGASGNIYAIDPANFMEDGQLLPLRIESAAVEQFPQWVRVARADFHVETGVGVVTGIDPIQTDPTLQISWTDDGGVNWRLPVVRKIGRQAQYKDVSVFQVGLTTRHGRRWRLDFSDPVYFALFGGDQAAEVRASGGQRLMQTG